MLVLLQSMLQLSLIDCILTISPQGLARLNLYMQMNSTCNLIKIKILHDQDNGEHYCSVLSPHACLLRGHREASRHPGLVEDDQRGTSHPRRQGHQSKLQLCVGWKKHLVTIPRHESPDRSSFRSVCITAPEHCNLYPGLWLFRDPDSDRRCGVYPDTKTYSSCYSPSIGFRRQDLPTQRAPQDHPGVQNLQRNCAVTLMGSLCRLLPGLLLRARTMITAYFQFVISSKQSAVAKTAAWKQVEQFFDSFVRQSFITCRLFTCLPMDIIFQIISIRQLTNMKSLLVLALFFLLLLPAWSKVTEQHIDIPASVTMANVALLTRVDRIMNIDYSYALDGRNIWTQYPEMNVEISLLFDQYVQLYQIISIYAGGQPGGWLATRIKINGVQLIQTRRHTGPIECPSLSLNDKIYLTKGNHRVTLEYRSTSGRVQDIPKSDWRIAYFRVSYYKPADS